MLVDGTDNVITLADGRKIGANGREIKPQRPMTAIPSNSEAKQIVVRANKRIADLPALPDKLNGISVILTYTLFGLAVEEIAIATGLTIEQINVIREHDSYKTLLEIVHKNVTEYDADVVRKTLQQHTQAAATNIVNMMREMDPKVALKASQDILDRSGFRPVDVVEHRHKLEGTLKIIHVDKKSTADLPVIDIKKDILDVEN